MPGLPLGPMIWPLRGKLFHPAFSRARPRSSGWRPLPRALVNSPWNSESSRVSTQDLLPPFPSVVHELLPKPAYNFQISGVTKDSAGAVLGSCTVKLYRTSDDVLLFTTTSDATTGAYQFLNASPFFACYVVAYKAGSPDTAGTTVNTIIGT